jgi:hypothetical protein
MGGNGADESQQVQDDVHSARSRAALGSAISVLGVESRTRLEWLLSGRGWVFGRDTPASTHIGELSLQQDHVTLARAPRSTRWLADLDRAGGDVLANVSQKQPRAPLTREENPMHHEYR